MSVQNYTPTQEVQNVINRFEDQDRVFKAAFDELAAKYPTEFAQLEKLREGRNVSLDEAIKMLRDEASRLSRDKYPSFRFRDFLVKKPQGSDSFRAEEFVELSKSLNFKKAMQDAGVIQTKVVIDYDAAVEFLKKNNLQTKFAHLVMEGDMKTPSVEGPKPIPPLGQEYKGK